MSSSSIFTPWQKDEGQFLDHDDSLIYCWSHSSHCAKVTLHKKTLEGHQFYFLVSHNKLFIKVNFTRTHEMLKKWAKQNKKCCKVIYLPFFHLISHEVCFLFWRNFSICLTKSKIRDRTLIVLVGEIGIYIVPIISQQICSSSRMISWFCNNLTKCTSYREKIIFLEEIKCLGNIVVIRTFLFLKVEYKGVDLYLSFCNRWLEEWYQKMQDQIQPKWQSNEMEEIRLNIQFFKNFLLLLCISFLKTYFHPFSHLEIQGHNNVGCRFQ